MSCRTESFFAATNVNFGASILSGTLQNISPSSRTFFPCYFFGHTEEIDIADHAKQLMYMEEVHQM
jgi:hypothetical protein